MTFAEWTPGDEPVVGVATEGRDGRSDDRGDSGDLESVVRDRGGTVVSGPIDRVLDREPSVVVAAGEQSVLAAVRAETTVPVLPVDAGRGIRSVPPDRLSDAVAAVLEGQAVRRDRPLLAIDSDDGDVADRALFDVTLVTDEPARISEFAVRAGDERVAQFRADGVVVATPAGSHGYASAAGGPLLSPRTDCVAVVPIGPFVTSTRRWILPDDDVGLSVERDEGPVAICVDDEVVSTVGADSTVTISADGSLPTLAVPDSRAFFEDGSPG